MKSLMRCPPVIPACLTAVLCAAVHWGCSRAPEKPNVVLVSIDTLRADRLGCYGYDKGTSPFLDRLAREGILFENAIVQSNWTLPSHASILTSLYPAVHGARLEKDRMSARLLTMAEILKARGYDTAAFTDGGWISTGFGFSQGFDLFDDSSRGEEKDRRALHWMGKRRKKPFFLFYHSYDVHFPYTHHPSPRDFSRDSQLDEIARRINSGRYDLTDEEFEKAVLAWCTDRDFYRKIPPEKLAPLKGEVNRFFKERWPKMPSFRENLRYLVDAYDSGIRFFDRRLERLWGRMGEMGLHEKTVIIVTSDHGEGFLEHGALGHPEILYDEILRVPLIIVHPRLGRKGERFSEQVMSIDILPTALDMLGVKAPGRLQGRSFLPLIEGGPADIPRPAFADAVQVEAVRTDIWKLIESAAKEAPEPPELYDKAADPGEMRNLAGRDEQARGELEMQLMEWRSENERVRSELGLEGAEERAQPDEKTREQLRALGYMQ